MKQIEHYSDAIEKKMGNSCYTNTRLLFQQCAMAFFALLCNPIYQSTGKRKANFDPSNCNQVAALFSLQNMYGIKMRLDFFATLIIRFCFFSLLLSFFS